MASPFCGDDAPARNAARSFRLGPTGCAAGAALVLSAFLALLHAGSLTSVTPAAASSQISIAITGTGFNTVAASNEVTFTPVSGAPLTVTASAVTTLDAATGRRRLTVRVPDGLAVGRAALRVRDAATGEISEGAFLEVIRIILPATASAAQGATEVAVQVNGSPNTVFVAGATKLSFGAGITTTAITVHSPTSLTATVTVAPTAALGPRHVALSGPQLAIATNAFTVVGPNRAPVARPGGPYTGTVGQPVSFDGSTSSDPDGDPLSFQWQFGDQTSSEGATPSHLYGTPGTFTASLSVRDGRGGQHTQTVQVSIAAANRPPVSMPGGPYSGTAGQPVAFNGGASADDDGDALTYEWAFGDGATSVGLTAAHVYSAAGTFTGALTVRDGRGGTHTATFQVQVAPASLGRGVVTGAVHDDTTGLPLEGASAQLVEVGGAPIDAMPVLTDALGRFRLSGVPGLARIRITRNGFTSADLAVQIVDGRRVEPDDARLTPLDTRVAIVSAVAGGTATNSLGSRLEVPPAAFAQDQAIRLTRIGTHGLIRRLPIGWTPIAAVDVAGPAELFLTAARLSARAAGPVGSERVVVSARWDSTSASWICAGPSSSSPDGSALEADVTRAGQHVFARADLDGPAIPAAGSPLAAAAPRAPPEATLSLNPAPRVLFARGGARSGVTALAQASVAMPSGTPLEIELAERFAHTNGSVLLPTPGRRQLALYDLPGTPAHALSSSFTVTPSRLPAPSTLREGWIDLAGRLPLEPRAPRGRAFGAAGGEFVAPGGERVLVPAGASPEDLPVDARTIATADFPLGMPVGHTLLRALLLDLHGAPLARDVQLAVLAPAGLAPDALVLVAQLVDVGDATRLSLVALARQQSGELISTTDLPGTTVAHLPGVRGEGRYTFIHIDGAYGFVTGIITANGAPVGGALVETGSSTIAAIADPLGRFVVAAPVGSVDLRVSNPVTGDSSALIAQIDSALATTERDVALGLSPPSVIGVTPAPGATAVALGSAVTIRFSEPVDPSSVASDSIRLTAGNTGVQGTLAFAPGNASVMFRPAALLQSQTAYVITVAASIRDTAGHTLVAPFVSQFTTVDVTPPAPPAAGTVVASVPDASGNSTIAGSQGTADPGGVVIIRNLRNNALTTLTPNADGSFSGIVPALRTDRLEMTIRDAAGNETTVPVAAFRSPDGSVVVGSAGGRVEGPGGVSVDVPVGALPDGTVVRVSSIEAATFPIAPPDTFQFRGGVRLDLGGVVPLAPLRLAVPAPTATATDQVLVVRVLDRPERQVWTIVDQAQFVNGQYVDGPPQWPGITAQGDYAFILSSVALGFVSFSFDFLANTVLTTTGSPFQTLGIGAGIWTTPAAAGSPFTVQEIDPYTDEVIAEITQQAPPQYDLVRGAIVLSDDRTAPWVIGTFATLQQVEVRFSEPMAADSVRQPGNLVILGPRKEVIGGTFVPSTGPLFDGGSLVIFRPNVPFMLGTGYTVSVAEAADPAGNIVATRAAPQMFAFSTFTPSVQGEFAQVPDIRSELNKCRSSSFIGPLTPAMVEASCSTSVPDLAFIGKTLFLANGLRDRSESWVGESIIMLAQPLKAIDITDPSRPTLIGEQGAGAEGGTSGNPRSLSAVEAVNIAGVPGERDLLVVGSGGYIQGLQLRATLAVFDVTACRNPTFNCLDESFRARWLLSGPGTDADPPGIPEDFGIPLRMATLHQRSTGSMDTLIAYTLMPGIGIEAVDVLRAYTNPNQTRAPDIVLNGDFIDVSVVKNRVLAVERKNGADRLQIFNANLGEPTEVPLVLNGVQLPGARVAGAPNVPFDIDGDGNLGLAEDRDDDPTVATDELFDLALVSSGYISSGCLLPQQPCGDLYVVDVSSRTSLNHDIPPAIIARIPLPGGAFSIDVDTRARLAYVELRGVGLAIVDLSHLADALRGAPGQIGLLDANQDGRDDRLLYVVPNTRDIFMEKVRVDPTRGLVYVNGGVAGVKVLTIPSTFLNLSAEFGVANTRETKILLRHDTSTTPPTIRTLGGVRLRLSIEADDVTRSRIVSYAWSAAGGYVFRTASVTAQDIPANQRSGPDLSTIYWEGDWQDTQAATVSVIVTFDDGSQSRPLSRRIVGRPLRLTDPQTTGDDVRILRLVLNALGVSHSTESPHYGATGPTLALTEALNLEVLGALKKILVNDEAAAANVDVESLEVNTATLIRLLIRWADYLRAIEPFVSDVGRNGRINSGYCITAPGVPAPPGCVGSFTTWVNAALGTLRQTYSDAIHQTVAPGVPYENLLKRWIAKESAGAGHWGKSIPFRISLGDVDDFGSIGFSQVLNRFKYGVQSRSAAYANVNLYDPAEAIQGFAIHSNTPSAGGGFYLAFVDPARPYQQRASFLNGTTRIYPRIGDSYTDTNRDLLAKGVMAYNSGANVPGFTQKTWPELLKENNGPEPGPPFNSIDGIQYSIEVRRKAFDVDGNESTWPTLLAPVTWTDQAITTGEDAVCDSRPAAQHDVERPVDPNGPAHQVCIVAEAGRQLSTTVRGNDALETFDFSFGEQDWIGGTSWATKRSRSIPATIPAPPPPAAPSHLTASRVSASQVDLSWTDHAIDEISFSIERCSGADCSDFEEIASVDADVTTYSDTGLAAGVYRYRIRASNAAGQSSYTNVAQ